MSLDSPTTTEKVITAFKGWPLAVRIGVPLLILAIAIGGILFAIDRIGGVFSTHDINKARANVNAALVAVNAAKGTVANDKVDEAVALEKVKEAANDVVAASNATDAAKQAANQAVANFIAAKNANVPTGTTEADLDAKLRALGE